MSKIVSEPLGNVVKTPLFPEDLLIPPLGTPAGPWTPLLKPLVLRVDFLSPSLGLFPQMERDWKVKTDLTL